MADKFLKKLQNFIFHKQLLKTGDKVIVGISGGPDSVALALALKKLQIKMKLRLLLVHINYGLRGVDSIKDEQFVRKFARINNLDLKVIPFKSRRIKGNLEQILRDFRYNEFERLRAKIKYSRVAIAHNMDDQAETFFLNLLRGSGTKGLGSMKEKRDKIIRPLLVFSRKEITGFLKENKQGFRIDQTNQSPIFLRNKIRGKLIPYLEKNFLPNIRKRIFEISENLRDDYFLVERSGLPAYNNIAKRRGDIIVLDVKKALGHSQAEIKFSFRKAMEEVKGDLRDVSAKNFFEFEKILKSEKSKDQVLRTSGVVIRRKGAEIRFGRL